MHPNSIRNEFIRLRVHGVSLARIGRQLGVSKPTLIKWNRQFRPEIASSVAAARQRAQGRAVSNAADKIAELTRKYDALKQELLSRALRDVPTSHLEHLAGDFRNRLDSLNAQVGTTSTSSQNEPPESTANSQPSTLNSQLSSTEPIRT